MDRRGGISRRWTHRPCWDVGLRQRERVKVRVGRTGLKAQGLSPSSFWVARLSPLDDGSPSRFDSQPHRGLPGDHQPRPHG